jgi:probable HAF family extracellular repeat protein
MSGQKGRVIRGGRVCKRAGGLVSFAPVLAAAGVVLGAGGAVAQVAVPACPPDPVPSETMCDLGSLRSDNLGESRALAVSADGGTIVGRADTDDGDWRAFRWIDDGTGMLDLGTLRAKNSGKSLVYAVSADGGTIVGFADNDDGDWRAFRWIDDGTGMLDLGTFRADNSGYSYATDVSADGGTIVGYARTDDSSRAFRWIDAGTGKLDLGTLRADNSGHSYAHAVSADGGTIVGYADNDDGDWRAFRWIDAGTGMLDLGSLRSDNLGESRALAVSADGGTIVGYARTDDSSRAFRWIDDGTGMLDLGTLRADNSGFSYVNAVSADGGTIVGYADTDDGDRRASRWIDDGTGVLDLGSLRSDNLGESRALAVSADGSTIVGQAETEQGPERAFIWRGEMQDFENLLTSFPVLTNDSAVAAAQAQQGLGQTMRQGFFAGAGQFGVRVRAGFARTDRNPTTVGARSTNLGAVSLGYGVSDAVSLGVAASFDVTGLNNNGFDMEPGQGLAAWARYSAGGAAGTGLQAEAAFGWSRAEGALIRGRLLTGVALATGTSSLQTWGGFASVGYGFEAGGGWLVTPSLALSHYQTTRPGYSETGAPFNATYDDMTVSRTDLTLGLTAAFKVSEQGTLSLGAGIDREVAGQAAVLSGTSDIPGLATFNIPSSFVTNQTRGYVSAGYAHDFGNGMTLSGDLRVGHAVYGTSPEVRGGLALGFSF